MNESPRWLVEKNRVHDAAKALATVRGKSVDDADVVEELDEIIADFNGHEKMPLMAQLKASCASRKMFYRSSFVVILMFWQQWTGTNSYVVFGAQTRRAIVADLAQDQLLRPADFPGDRPGWQFVGPICK